MSDPRSEVHHPTAVPPATENRLIQSSRCKDSTVCDVEGVSSLHLYYERHRKKYIFRLVTESR